MLSHIESYMIDSEFQEISLKSLFHYLIKVPDLCQLLYRNSLSCMQPLGTKLCEFEEKKIMIFIQENAFENVAKKNFYDLNMLIK